MDVREFFEGAKRICDRNNEKQCNECPLNDYCLDGIFSKAHENVEEILEIIERETRNAGN